jgi:hypothetical protein
MIKVIVGIGLFLIVPKVLGQQAIREHNFHGPHICLSDRFPILNINYLKQPDVYSSMIRCPQSVNTINILYIIDGVPGSFENFDVLKPGDIMNIIITNSSQQHFYCGPPRDIVAIKTIYSLTKRQQRKFKRIKKTAFKLIDK